SSPFQNVHRHNSQSGGRLSGWRRVHRLYNRHVCGRLSTLHESDVPGSRETWREPTRSCRIQWLVLMRPRMMIISIDLCTAYEKP
ncbi:hypothetical protein PENTCL1PPCAC_27882, partial [Pristionchus entomophagus]